MSEILKQVKAGNASALIDLIKSSGCQTKEIPWPGRPEIKVLLRLMKADDTKKAKFENEQEFKSAGIALGAHNLADYRLNEAAHGMWRVILDPETREQVFKSVDQFRALLTDDEISYFVSQYNAFSAACDPNAECVSDGDYEELLDLLKKTPDLIPLKVTNLNTAWRLLLISASRQAK